jgi:hypothetical protein
VIENRMNCWNTLRASQNHNVASNGKRDGVKICRIGQSAAKRLSSFEPFNLESKIFKNDSICRFISSPSTRNKFLELKANFSLLALPSEVREKQFENASRRLVSPDDLECGFPRWDDSRFNGPVELVGNKFDGFALAHHNFENDSVLKADWTSHGSEAINHDATLAIDNTGKICNFIKAHGNNLQRRTSNDYAERQYSQAAGRMRPSYHTKRVDDIVFSARKRVAAHKGRCQRRALARKLKAYVGDDYMAIGWPTTFRSLKNTLETLHQYTESGIKLIFNGEIGRYENMRYVEQTQITKGITATGRSGVAWTGGDSDWIFFFGEDTVAEGIAIPEEMRAKIPTDFGRSKGVAWYALLGFGIVHTNAVQARIIMWDSAA